MQNTDHDSIADAAMKLPPDRRAWLADRLLSSLDESYRADVEAAWREEIDRRVAAFECGEMESLDGEEILRDLEQGRRP